MSALPDISQLFTPAQLQAIRQLIAVKVAEELRRRDAEETLLTRRQVAERYGKTPKTVSNWISAGRIPVLPSGHVRASDLDSMYNSGITPGTRAAEDWVRAWRAEKV